MSAECKPRALSPRAADAAMPVLSVPADAVNAARGMFNEEQETFVVLLVNVRNRMVVPPLVVALGTVHGVEVHPRDVFRAAIRHNAAGIILMHNHPSGDPTPSVDDYALTKRLVEVGELVGVPVVDHVVVCSNGSFRSIAECDGGL